MPLKIAVTGKGGVGKTTVAAILASLYAKEGRKVLAVDADPASSLMSALGVSEELKTRVVPLSGMLDLIEERTGARPGEASGGLFALNPKVDDLVERYAVRADQGVEVMVLGTISAPGAGCFCPESALLKALLQHLVLEDDRVVVVDMEAGLEHLGRSTLQGIDVLLVVVEPGQRSVGTAERIAAMARELGVRRVLAVLNKVSRRQQEEEVRGLLVASDLECLSSIPFDARLVEADLSGLSSTESGAELVIAAIASLKAAIDERVSAPEPPPLKDVARR